MLHSGCGLALDDAARVERARAAMAESDHRSASIDLKAVLQNDPTNVEARVLLGEASLRQGDPVSAQKELLRARDLGASVEETRLLLATAYRDQGNFQAALDTTNEEGGADTDDLELLIVRGQAAAALRDFDAARDAFDRAITLAPRDHRAHLGHAALLAASGDRAGARDKILAVLSDNPDVVKGWLALAGLESSERNQDAAATAYRKALELSLADAEGADILAAQSGLIQSLLGGEHRDEARRLSEDLLERYPEHPLALYIRGRVAYDEGEFSEAAPYFQAVLTRMPGHLRSELYLGAVSFQQGNLGQAEVHLQRVVNRAPGNAMARKMLAQTRIRMQRPEAAVEALEPALDEGVMDSELLAMAGRATLQAGSLEDGIRLMERSVEADPDNTSLSLQLAASYVMAGRYDDAQALLGGLPTEDEAVEARRDTLLIMTQMRGGDVEGATQQVDALLADRPDDASLHLMRGALYLQADDTESGARSFERALELSPDNVIALVTLARLEYLEGDVDAARGRFQALLDQRPDNAVAMMALARLDLEAGDEASAVAYMERARAADEGAFGPRLALARYHYASRQMEQAEELAAEALRLQPDNPDALTVQGLAQLASGQRRDALLSLQAALAQRPDSLVQLYNVGRAQALNNDRAGARESFSRVLAESPDSVPAMAAMARLDIADRNTDAAVTWARKIREAQPDSAVGWVLEGDARMTQRSFEAAAEAYQEATKLSEDPQITLKRYAALRNAGDGSAVGVLETRIASHPDEVPVRLALAQEYHGTGQVDAAVEAYEEAIRRDPGNAVAMNNLAWILYEKGDDRALGLAERAYGAAPGVPAIADTYGWLLVENGSVERGVRILRKAASDMPQSAQVRYHLGAALAREGSTDEARTILAELVASGAEFEELDEASRLLESL